MREKVAVGNSVDESCHGAVLISGVANGSTVGYDRDVGPVILGWCLNVVSRARTVKRPLLPP